MESDKIPFLLEELVTQLTDKLEWSSSTSGVPRHNLPTTPPSLAMQKLVATLTAPARSLDMHDVQRERHLLGKHQN